MDWNTLLSTINPSLAL